MYLQSIRLRAIIETTRAANASTSVFHRVVTTLIELRSNAKTLLRTGDHTTRAGLALQLVNHRIRFGLIYFFHDWLYLKYDSGGVISEMLTQTLKST